MRSLTCCGRGVVNQRTEGKRDLPPLGKFNAKRCHHKAAVWCVWRSVCWVARKAKKIPKILPIRWSLNICITKSLDEVSRTDVQVSTLPTSRFTFDTFSISNLKIFEVKRRYDKLSFVLVGWVVLVRTRDGRKHHVIHLAIIEKAREKSRPIPRTDHARRTASFVLNHHHPRRNVAGDCEAYSTTLYTHTLTDTTSTPAPRRLPKQSKRYFTASVVVFSARALIWRV